ncbi:MAG: glycosyltransferase family 4 protein [Pseudomonadota bacterium]
MRHEDLSRGSARPATSRTLVIQAGARHGYAFPAMLAEADRLAFFQTTTALAAGQSPGPAMVLASRVFSRLRAALARRRAPLAPDLLAVAPGPDILRAGCRVTGAGHMRARLAQNAALGRAALVSSARWPRPTSLLAVDGGGGAAALARFRRSGVPIIVDIAVTPTALRTVADAARRHPDWADGAPSEREIRRFEEHYARLVAVADWIFYPSTAVLQGLETIPGFDPARAREVPYPVARSGAPATATEPGRVLFVGSDPLRKGLPDLAPSIRMAAVPLHLVVAGQLPRALCAHPDLCGATLLGHVPAARLAAEYARADILVLPSLAEGMPAVAVEAMAAGVPVVATQAAGTPVVHGVSGLIVPPNNPQALAHAMTKIVGDRGRRAQMSDAARRRAEAYRPESVARILLDALDHVEGGRS